MNHVAITLKYADRTSRRFASETALSVAQRSMRGGKVERITLECDGVRWFWDRAQIAYNAEIEAKHARLREQILKLRPHWSPAKLEAVKSTYSGGDTANLGLINILDACQRADDLNAKFSK